MRFRKGNQYRYTQARSQHRGIPHGVDFNVRLLGKGSNVYVLTAHGYGCVERDPHRCMEKRCYGNGALFVWGLTARQRARFDAAAKAGRPGLRKPT